jgi:phosphatidylserine decarboxylase
MRNLSMSDRLAVLPQYLLPKKARPRLPVVAGAEAGSLTTALIRWFAGRYKVNMRKPPIGLRQLSGFNAFYPRAESGCASAGRCRSGMSG